MKRIFLLTAIGLAFIMASCVDENYDLSNLDTDNMALGGDQSEFVMPLLSIKFKSGNICQAMDDQTSSIMELRNRINVWLPSTLPNDDDFIDIQALREEPEYKRAILNNLFVEMKEDASKRAEICEHIIDLYLQELLNALYNSSSPALKMATYQIMELPKQEQATLLSDLFINLTDEIKPIFEEISNEDLVKTSLEDVYAEIPSLDISEDIEQMLSENLDPSSVENPINALYLFGEINSDFPFKFHVRPTIEYTQIDMGELYIDNATTQIPDTRIYHEDLNIIFNGSKLIMPIMIDRYYPYEEFHDHSQISISISLRKTGGLKI